MQAQIYALYQRRQVNQMNGEMIVPYLDRIYGYAFSHTYSREEADELSQTIVLTVLQSMPALRDATRFEPWLWSLAANVTRTFRRNLGKQRAMYVWDTWETLDVLIPDEGAERTSLEDEYAQLREKNAKLSANYRDVIILHYYDGLPVKEIAKRLGEPVQ